MDFETIVKFPWKWVAIAIFVLVLVCAILCRRRKLSYVALISTILFVPSAVAWVASYWGEPQIMFTSAYPDPGLHPTSGEESANSLSICSGGMCLFMTHSHTTGDNWDLGETHYIGTSFRKKEVKYPNFEGSRVLNHLPINWGGIQYAYGRTVRGGVQAIVLPAWLVLGVLSVAPVAWLVRHFRHRHVPRGFPVVVPATLNSAQTPPAVKCPEYVPAPPAQTPPP